MSDRVLDPPGALPHTATRLDPVGALRPGERLLALEALALGPTGEVLRRPDGARALQHAAQDRGGLPTDAGDGVLVGRLPDGQRAAVMQGLAGLPAWVVRAGPWDGRDAVVPLEGHAVLGPDVATTRLADAAPVDAVVRRAVEDAVARVAAAGVSPLLVLGGGAASVVAAAAAAAAGRVVVTTADDLGTATALRSLDVRVVVDQGDGAATRRERLATALGPQRSGCHALVLGPLPPCGPATVDGGGSAHDAELAGTLARTVEVVGSVDVSRVVTATGARVLAHPLAARADGPAQDVGTDRGEQWG